MIQVESNFGKNIRVIETKLPALVSVIKEINKPRYATMNGIKKAFEDKQVVTWGKDDLKINPMHIGLSGSPTQVKETFSPVHQREGKIVEDSPADNACDFLKENNFIC